MHVDKTIASDGGGTTGSKVWIIIAIHAGTSEFQVTDIKFVK